MGQFKVTRLKTHGGNNVANHYIITTELNGIYFQSYDSVICHIKNGKLTLSQHYDYSFTTLKTLYKFLRQYGYGELCNTKAMREAIDSGVVILENADSLSIK